MFYNNERHTKTNRHQTDKSRIRDSKDRQIQTDSEDKQIQTDSEDRHMRKTLIKDTYDH